MRSAPRSVRERLIAITGNDALTGFTAPKLVWVRDHEPELWRRAAHVLLPKDYLRLRLTGEHAMDKADGSGTLLFDLAARDWSARGPGGARDPDRDWLPPTFEGPQVTGAVTERAAAATGLRAGTPVVAGGGDQAANAVGVGVVSPGTIALSLGTSGVVFAATDRPLYEPRGPRPRVLPRGPGSLAPDVGDAVRRRQPALVPRRARPRRRRSRDLVASAADVPAGAEGLFFLPYLSGERSPHPDPLARGAFVGLTLGHDRRHMTRAVLEGVAFGLRDGLDLDDRGRDARPDPDPRVGRRHRQPALASDPGRRPRRGDRDRRARPRVRRTAPALLAAVAAGWYPTVEAAVGAVVRVTPVAEPGPDAAAYAERHAVYRELYPALAPTFPRL